MTFQEHKEITIADLSAIQGLIEELKNRVAEGDMAAFEKFWIEGGTAEGDAKICSIRENLFMRYFYRAEQIN